MDQCRPAEETDKNKKRECREICAPFSVLQKHGWKFIEKHKKYMKKSFDLCFSFLDFRKLYMDSKENDWEQTEIQKK